MKAIRGSSLIDPRYYKELILRVMSDRARILMKVSIEDVLHVGKHCSSTPIHTQISFDYIREKTFSSFKKPDSKAGEGKLDEPKSSFNNKSITLVGAIFQNSWKLQGTRGHLDFPNFRGSFAF